jgi:hypothetical protein
VDLDDLNGLAGAFGERVDESQRREIQPAVADRVEQFDRSGLVQLDVVARMFGAKALQAVGDVEQSRHRADLRARCVSSGERTAGLGEQRSACVAQLDPAGGAHEEGHAELALERADRCRDRRLRHMQPRQAAQSRRVRSWSRSSRRAAAYSPRRWLAAGRQHRPAAHARARVEGSGLAGRIADRRDQKDWV